MPRARNSTGLALLLLGCAVASAPAQEQLPAELLEFAADLPEVFFAKFEPESNLDEWTFTDRNAWQLTQTDGRTVLDQKTASQYEPPFRSPFNIALLPGVEVGDMVMDVTLKSTARDYDHRDVCIFFGYRDPSHFYYVHIAKQADEHANSIFLVNGKPRVSVAKTRTEGTVWTNGWHHVRIVRKLREGVIEVYFDDMRVPVMVANDTTFGAGRVGVGTFDDTAQFAEIQVWGR